MKAIAVFFFLGLVSTSAMAIDTDGVVFDHCYCKTTSTNSRSTVELIGQIFGIDQDGKHVISSETVVSASSVELALPFPDAGSLTDQQARMNQRAIENFRVDQIFNTAKCEAPRIPGTRQLRKENFCKTRS